MVQFLLPNACIYGQMGRRGGYALKFCDGLLQREVMHRVERCDQGHAGIVKVRVIRHSETPVHAQPYPLSDFVCLNEHVLTGVNPHRACHVNSVGLHLFNQRHDIASCAAAYRANRVLGAFYGICQKCNRLHVQSAVEVVIGRQPLEVGRFSILSLRHAEVFLPIHGLKRESAIGRSVV